MNLLCPNCQKMLTVPEQYAGQLMKCPLCAGTFTVPNVPGGSPGEAAPAFSAPPSPPAPSPSAPETYGVKADPEPAFRAAEAPAFAVGPPEPAFSAAPAAGAQADRPAPTPAASPAATPDGYTRTVTVPADAK